MPSIPIQLPADYWSHLTIERRDIEFLSTRLFELESPLTTRELVHFLVEERIRYERETLLAKKQAGGEIYLPARKYQPGQELVFPALEWKRGRVVASRPGSNPAIGEFEVIQVAMESGEERSFAAALPDHPLNQAPEPQVGQETELDPATIVRTFGPELEQKLQAALLADKGLVRIAGRWFPRALLVDVNQGHLNLAEAVLEMAGGEPLPTPAFLKDLDLGSDVNPKLVEFSLNYALQQDERFDEVGATGQVLWCLRRLEPEGVQSVPPTLRYQPIEFNRSLLTPAMLALEAELDDELSQLPPVRHGDEKEAVVSLTYPHWRAGTLPVSSRLEQFFPSAYESPRVRFTLVDGRDGRRMPGWVVRHERYVYGLQDWYRSLELIPGSLIRVRRGDNPGEVVLSAQTRRASRDWVRTALVGADGVLVFAMLRQMVTADFNERMVIAVPDPEAVDRVWQQMNRTRPPFVDLVTGVMRELVKLTPQGHVHAQELYSAVNILRRCPPAPLFALLASDPRFVHVGDLHYRLDESTDD